MKSESELDRNICTGSTMGGGTVVVDVLLWLSLSSVDVCVLGGIGGDCNEDAR